MANILIADDEISVRETLGMVCRLDGHVVRFAVDTPTTLMAYASSRPDLLLLDLVMPGGGGVEVVRQLRGAFPGALCPIVVVTGYLDSVPGEEREALGAFKFVEKPFTIESLRSVVRAALASGGAT